MNEVNEWIENRIGMEGAGMISEALKCNISLTQLNLSGDGIEPIETKWLEMKQVKQMSE